MAKNINNKLKKKARKDYRLILLALLLITFTSGFSFVWQPRASSVVNSSNQITSVVESSTQDSSFGQTITNEISLVAVEVDKLPRKTQYFSTDTISTAGGVLRLSFSDYSVKYIPMNDQMVDYSRLNLSQVGAASVPLKVELNKVTKYTNYPVTVIPFVLLPTKVTLDIKQSDVTFDQQLNLNYVVEPTNAEFFNAVWTSSNEIIATVDQEGRVTPKNPGVVVITLTIDNIVSDTATLNILPRVVISSGPSAPPAPPAPTDTTAPVVSNATMSSANLTATSVTLNWFVGSDETTATNLLTYKIYRNSSAITSFGIVGNSILVHTGTNINTFNVTGLNGSSTYYFNIVVEDQAGNRTLYSGLSVTTLTPDNNAPTLTSGTILVTNVTNNSVTLNWAAASDDITAASSLIYYVHQDSAAINNLNDATLLNQIHTSTNIVNYVINGLNSATTYQFNVVVQDAAGNKTIYTNVSATTADLPLITNLSISLNSPSEILDNNLSVTYPGTITFRTTKTGNYYISIYNVAEPSVNDIFTNNSVPNYQSAAASTGSNITITLPSLSYHNNYSFKLFVADGLGNFSNIITETLFNHPTVLIPRGWYPIATPQQLALIELGTIPSGTTLGVAPYSLTLNSDLSLSRNKNYFLVSDLDFSSFNGNWTPIGTGGNFTGSFDGRRHKISNFHNDAILFGNVINANQPSTWSIANSENESNFRDYFGNFDFVNPNYSSFTKRSMIIDTIQRYVLKNINIYSTTGSTMTYSGTDSMAIVAYDTESIIADNIVTDLNITTSTEESAPSMFVFLENMYGNKLQNRGNLTSTNSSGNANAFSGTISNIIVNYVKINASSNYGNLSAPTNVGGLIGGFNNKANLIINQSYNIGDITSISSSFNIGSAAGGLFGSTLTAGGSLTVINSYNSGVIKSINDDRNDVGGLIGYYGNQSGTAFDTVNDKIIIERSYSSSVNARTSGSVITGGIIGEITLFDGSATRKNQTDLNTFMTTTHPNNFVFTNNYFNNSSPHFVSYIAGTVNSGASLSNLANKYEAKTLENLKNTSTFATWDFTNIWNINQTYTTPYLIAPLELTVNKTVITEGSGNSGVLGNVESDRIIQITLKDENKNFKDVITKNDVILNNLPAGLDYIVEYLDPKNIAIRLTEAASPHTAAQSSNLKITIKPSIILGSSMSLTTAVIRLNFTDPAI